MVCCNARTYIALACLLFLNGCGKEIERKEFEYREPESSIENINKLTLDILSVSEELKKSIARFKSDVPLYEANDHGLLRDLVALGYVNHENISLPFEWRYKEKVNVFVSNKEIKKSLTYDVLYSSMPISELNQEVCKKINSELKNSGGDITIDGLESVVLNDEGIYLESDRVEYCGNSGSSYDYYIMLPN